MKVIRSIRILESTYRTIKKLSKKEGRLLSGQLEVVVQYYLKHKKIKV